MAHVVLLRGVNVGGSRVFRPSKLVEQLTHLGAVNVGTAGTFVVRKPIGHARLRAEFARRLPFDATIMICQGRDIVRMLAADWFNGVPERPDLVRFVTVLAGPPTSAVPLPLDLPQSGTWLLKVVARDRRFVFGVYRRHMKTVGYLGRLDKIFGVAGTTRNWNTIGAIAKVLDSRR